MLKLMMCLLGVASAVVALSVSNRDGDRAQGLLCVSLVCMTCAVMVVQAAP